MKMKAVFLSSALVCGNLVGAGILGLPVQCGFAGLPPSAAGLFLGCALMLWSAFLIGDAALGRRDADFDFPSYYKRCLGTWGRLAAVAANLLILYGLLVAYLTGGAGILVSLLGLEGWDRSVLLAFALLMIVLSNLNLSLLQKFNALLVLGLLVFFLAIVIESSGAVDARRWTRTDWIFLPMALPVIVTSFHFHNIIPALSSELDWNRKALRLSILIGMGAALLMNFSWVASGIGTLPLEGANGIFSAWQHGQPATLPMQAFVPGNAFRLFAGAFALAAISTSFLANGVGLTRFLADLLHVRNAEKSRWLPAALAFLPPAAIAFLYPGIFLDALDLVGGVGVLLLFGILPFFVHASDRSVPRPRRFAAVAAILVSAAVMAVEIGREFGLLYSRSWVESRVSETPRQQTSEPAQIFGKPLSSRAATTPTAQPR